MNSIADKLINPILELTGVGIEFPTPKGPFKALTDVNLKISKGEMISLIGHSGCGKSTVLNIVAGLLQATEGGAVLEGKEVNDRNHCCAYFLLVLLSAIHGLFMDDRRYLLLFSLGAPGQAHSNSAIERISSGFNPCSMP